MGNETESSVCTDFQSTILSTSTRVPALSAASRTYCVYVEPSLVLAIFERHSGRSLFRNGFYDRLVDMPFRRRLHGTSRYVIGICGLPSSFEPGCGGKQLLMGRLVKISEMSPLLSTVAL